MADRNPALARLDVLIGRWTVRPKVDGLGDAWTEFTWQDNGLFLRQFSDAPPPADTAPEAWQANSPFPVTSLIGLDDATDEFTMLYADGRGVHRAYRMTFADGDWKIWRNAPEFHQRFFGTLSADGNTVDTRWEFSRDGTMWDLDFEMTYLRER
jgi:hypothetical protein